MKKLILILLTTAAAGFAETFEPVSEIDGVPVRRAIPIEEARTYDATRASTPMPIPGGITFDTTPQATQVTPEQARALTGFVGAIMIVLLIIAIARSRRNSRRKPLSAEEATRQALAKLGKGSPEFEEAKKKIQELWPQILRNERMMREIEAAERQQYNDGYNKN